MAKGKDNSPKIEMKLQLPKLEAVLLGLLDNPLNAKFVSNVKKYFDVLDINSFQNEDKKHARILIGKQICDIIIGSRIYDRNHIEDLIDCSGKLAEEMKTILDTKIKDKHAPTELVSKMSDEINTELKYAYLSNDAREIIDMFTDLQTENYLNKEDLIAKIAEKTKTLNTKLTESSAGLNDSKNDLNMDGMGLDAIFNQIIDDASNESYKIKTGIKALNDMVNGGWEPERVYCLMAPAKGFKSASLMNIFLDAKKYNGLKAKDPTKQPVILYLTLENSVKDTIGRVLSWNRGDDFNVKGKKVEELKKFLEEDGIINPVGSKEATIDIKYRSHKSIDCNDIKQMLLDYEKQGQECVFVVIDYVKRLKSIMPFKEERSELGAIVNDMQTLAKEFSIPVVTAMQLNRNAFATLEAEQTFEGKMKAIERLGASHIGDSIDIVQNFDVGIIIGVVDNFSRNEVGIVESKDRFISVNAIASRIQIRGNAHFKHPFKTGYGLRFDADIDSPMTKSIFTDFEMHSQVASNKPVKVQPKPKGR